MVIIAGRYFCLSSAEPLRTYEERRKAATAKKDTKDAKDTKEPKEPKEPAMGEGMMAGVTKPGGGGPEDEKKKMLPVTPLGRYLKVLLSSNEFLFID